MIPQRDRGINEGYEHRVSLGMALRILIGGDHAGYELKEKLTEHLAAQGIAVSDAGTRSMESVDYPDYAHAVADGVTGGLADLGILICGSGNGVNMTANKHKGIRSALAWNTEIAALARQHNNANVLALPARFVTTEEAFAITDAFLASSFEGGRHQRRSEKIESTK